LLSAENGDVVRVGSLNLEKMYPDVKYTPSKSIWLANCDEIMIGNQTLETYMYRVVNRLPDNPAEHGFSFIWRDTSPSYYQLENNVSTIQFIEGAYSGLDIPMFHSVDVETSLIGFSAISDMFGNQYLAVSGGLGFSAGVAYTEGFLCTGNHKCDQDTYLSEDKLKSAMTGICGYGFVSAWILGGSVYYCSPDGLSDVFMATYSTGAMVAADIGASLTFENPIASKDPYKGWDWAIEDRRGGIDAQKVLNMAYGGN
jgi:hypothetical protein